MQPKHSPSKPHGDLGAFEVVDLDREEREAGALVPEGEVDAFLGDVDGARLRVDDDLVVVGEPALVGGNHVDLLVALGLPRRRLARGRVELVVEEGEGLLALQRRPRKQVAVAQRELDLDVDAVRVVPGQEESALNLIRIHVCQKTQFKCFRSSTEYILTNSQVFRYFNYDFYVFSHVK